MMPVLRIASALGAALVLLAPALSAGSGSSGRRYSVAAIGDSLTDPRAGGGKFLGELRRLCPSSRFDAYGIGGQQTLHMRWRFAHDVLGRGRARPPPAYSHVIVLGGVNDLLTRSFRYAPTRPIERNLSAMYASARRHGIRVVAVTIPPWGKLRGVADAREQATDALNAWILEREKLGEVDHGVDIRDALSCGDPRTLCPGFRRFPDDRLHWNPAGHRAVARVLHERVFADCK
jgi:hypothetical protein